VRSILENPRYTGYACFGRWARQEMLLDPDDVAAGHVTRFRRAAPDRVVRSRYPAHPAIVTVETFTQANCSVGRRPREDWLQHARQIGAAEAARETTCCEVWCGAASVAALNGWIGGLFARENVDATVAGLVASQGSGVSGGREAAKTRVAQAEVRLWRLRAAIEAGVDPGALVAGINEAQAERATARAELENASEPEVLTDAEIYAMIDSLGDVGAALSNARSGSLSRLYQRLGVRMRYEPQEQAVFVTAETRVDSACVRGAARTASTRNQKPSELRVSATVEVARRRRQPTGGA
jgi:hypothetical protein